MTAKKLLCLFLIPYSLSLTPLLAQQKVIDSLRNALSSQKDDTSKVNTLNALSDKLWRTANFYSALVYANYALTLANTHEYENGRGWAYRNIGTCCYKQTNYPSALINLQEGLSVFQKIKNKKGISVCLLMLGNVCNDLGNYPKSLENYYKALDINQEIGNKTGVAATLNNIGLIYDYQKNFSK